MTTVYVVTSGEYSDYGIDAVFSTKEKAQEYINFTKKWDKETHIYSNNYDIEEFTLDNFDGIQDRLNNGYKYYYCWMERDGTSGVEIYFPTNENRQIELVRPTVPEYKTFIRVFQWAKSEEHIIKATNEKRAQLIANGEWDE